MISARNSIGFEFDHQFIDLFKVSMKNIKTMANEINLNRIRDHIEFIKKCKEEGQDLKHNAINYTFPVFTKQESNILLYSILNFTEKENEFLINYDKFEFMK
jgi:hypothetical protein